MTAAPNRGIISGVINLFVVHQAHLVASLIASLLSDEPDILVTGQAGSAADALRKLARVEADVLLIDATLPDNGALALTAQVSERYPQQKIIVFGMPASQTLIVQT